MKILAQFQTSGISEEELKAVRKDCSLRRADRYTAITLHLIRSMQNNSGIAILPDATLICVASFGPLSTTFGVLDDILDYPEDQILPTRFSHSVHNAAASYVAAQFHITGPSYSVTGFEDPWSDALALAESLLATGAPQVLLFSVEEKTLLSPQLPELYPERFPSPGTEGGTVMLLSSDYMTEK